MTALLILCVTRADSGTTPGAVLLLCSFGSGCLYAVVSLISLIVRLFRRGRLAESDAMKDSFMGVLLFRKNGNTINFFRRLAFWGTLMAIVNVFALDISGEMIAGGPYSTDAFLAMYHGFLFWSMLALIVAFPLSLLFWRIYMPHYGTGAYNIFQYMGKIIWNDVTVPIAIIRSFFTKDKGGSREKGRRFSLTVMMLFIAVNAIAIFKSL